MATTIGLDIGSYAVKLAVVEHGFNKKSLKNLAAAYNPIGQSVPVDSQNQAKLAETIKTLLREQKVGAKQVYGAIPESLTYTSIISMPYLSDAELASSIHWEAEQHIPVPLDELNLEYEVLYKPPKGEVAGKMRILLVAAKKETIEQLVELYHLAGLEIVGLETGLLAAHRALFAPMAATETIIVSVLGALSTDVLILHQGEPVVTYTAPMGGLALTRALEKSLGLQPAQAEEYKRAYGLDGGQLEGKVRAVLAPSMNLVVAEIRKAWQFFQTGHPMEGGRVMLIAGGGAYLPGVTNFLTESFGMETNVANPLGGLTVANSGLPDNPAAFTTAVGLALRTE